MKQARSALSTLVAGLFCSALAATTGTSHLLYATFKSDPDGGKVTPILLSIAAAGILVQLFYLLSRVGQDKPMDWRRWIGEAALGGVTAYVFAASLYTYGPSTTPIGLSIFGVFGGFFGQRGLVWLFSTVAKLRNLSPMPEPPAPSPPTPPKGGGPDVP